MRITLKFPYGMRPNVDKKDLPEGCSFFQQNFVNSPLNSLTTRSGYFKKNTTVLAGAVMGVYCLRTRSVQSYIAFSSDGSLNTIL